MKIGVSVMDAMTKKPVSVSPDENITNCTKIMLDKHVGSLLVKENEKLLGFLTERDLVRMISMGIDPKTTKVKQIMTTRIITITPEKDIYDAITLMNRENIRRLPVMVNERVIGLITLKDILAIQPTLFELTMDMIDIKNSPQKM
ncbi:CBS domain-containing protein [Candidatus Woesearchaeota archaeon]|nr:CBS domain-containing protein [Candidatus Woesearchaeota archaeon]